MKKTVDQPTFWRMLPVLAILAILGLICYWFVLKLPLFWDDIFQFTWLDGVSFAQVFTTPVTGLNYFRPLAFALWKGVRVLQGAWDGAGQHAVNLALHILNAWLLALIAAQMAPAHKVLAGLGTGALFVLFSFSVQAVAPVNSLMHPLHVSIILAATLTYLLSRSSHKSSFVPARVALRRSRGRGIIEDEPEMSAGLTENSPLKISLRIVSILLAGAAIFAHENGVLAAALVTLTALCATPRQKLPRLILEQLPYWIAVAAGFLLWRSAPRAGDPLPLGGIFTQLESRLQNTTYFLQALAYPASSLARLVKSWLGNPNDVVALLAVCLPCIVIWFALALAAKRGRYAAWGLAWFAIGALPTVAMLGFNYVLESPRLLYLAAIGAAIFWAAPLTFEWQSTAASRISLGLSALVIIAIGAWGFVYIQRRAGLYSLLGQSIQQVQAESERDIPCAQGARPSTLLVNYPAWFFVDQPEYLVGHDGITTLSEGQTFGELYRINFGRAREFTTTVLPDVLPRNAVYHGLGESQTQDSLQPLIRKAGQVIVNTAPEAGVDLRYAGCLSAEEQAIPMQYQALIGYRLLLLYSDLVADPARGEIKVTLDWQAQVQDLEDVTIFTQLLDASGKLVAQADGYALDGTSPSRLWKMGDQYRDVRIIHVPGGALPAGDYRVLVGAYVTQGGARLPAEDCGKHRLPDDAVVISGHR